MREYSDITCQAALAELKDIKDPYPMTQVMFARDAMDRVSMGERTILHMFSQDPMFRLIPNDRISRTEPERLK